MEATLKSFFCSKHPSETISRAAAAKDISQVVYCLECLLENKPEEKLLPFKDYINSLASTAEEPVSETRLGPQQLPLSIASILHNQQSALSALKEHINSEKVRVNAYYDEVQQQIDDTIGKRRRQVLQKLDHQVTSLEEKFDYLRQWGKVYFEGSNGQLYRNKGQLVHTLNSLSDSSQLNLFLKAAVRQLQAPTTPAESDKSKLSQRGEAIRKTAARPR